jgi:hypothetical protein
VDALRAGDMNICMRKERWRERDTLYFNLPSWNKNVLALS